MGNPFEDLRQAVVVRPMNSPGPQGAAGPEVKIQYSFNGSSWHDAYVEHDKYIRFSTDNGVTWSNAIYFNNLAETLEWVERARQWAENPENDPVITPDQYSALHHAIKAARSEFNAEAAALEAENLVSGAYGIAPPLWNRITVYNYNDIVSFDNGQVYRCIGTNIIGETHAPNINGIDNKEDWTRVTAVLDGFFEVDENGDFMPMIAPVNSDIFMLDKNGDIMYQDPIDIEVSMATIELFTLDENGDIAYRDPTDHRPGGGNIELYKEIEFVDSIADFRSSSFYGTTKYVYVAGYYGAGTPGGGMFYKDLGSYENDNGGTIIVDNSGIRWKRANVHEEYYASWFGVSTNIDDNSPLIQNALNAMPTGATLVFGPGTYNCKQTIKIPEIIPNNKESSLKKITIRGSSELSIDRSGTVLNYVGPNPLSLTPFFDFRGNTFNKHFEGAIIGISFNGIGKYKNIVGLWLHQCTQSVFDNIELMNFKYGIQINWGYWGCEFNNIRFGVCEYGMRTNFYGNGAVINYCNFQGCDVGFGHSLNAYWCSGVYLNGCYFEGNKIAIRSSLGHLLRVNQCYFEGNSEYLIDVFTTDNSVKKSLLLVLENSYISVNTLAGLPSNKAIIRQTLPSNFTMTVVINNNTFEYVPADFDYLIYIASGEINIKAENNKSPGQYGLSEFPICSKTPLKSSYFNNDFNNT